MSKNKLKNSTHNDKKNDGKFNSKNVKHDPQAESARAVYGMSRNQPFEDVGISNIKK